MELHHALPAQELLISHCEDVSFLSELFLVFKCRDEPRQWFVWARHMQKHSQTPRSMLIARDGFASDGESPYRWSWWRFSASSSSIRSLCLLWGEWVSVSDCMLPWRCLVPWGFNSFVTSHSPAGWLIECTA